MTNAKYSHSFLKNIHQCIHILVYIYIFLNNDHGFAIFCYGNGHSLRLINTNCLTILFFKGF